MWIPVSQKPNPNSRLILCYLTKGGQKVFSLGCFDGKEYHAAYHISEGLSSIDHKLVCYMIFDSPNEQELEFLERIA